MQWPDDVLEVVFGYAATDTSVPDHVDAEFVRRWACTSQRHFLGPLATNTLLLRHMSGCMTTRDPIRTLIDYCNWRHLFLRSPAHFYEAYHRTYLHRQLLAAFAILGGPFVDLYTCPVMSWVVREWSHSKREFAMALVRFHGPYLRETSRTLRNDKDIVLAAVQDTGCALAFASERLKHERDVVECAVCTDGSALAFAPDFLKEDPRIVRLALTSDGNALFYAGAAFRQDLESVRLAVRTRSYAIELAPDEFRRDPQIRCHLPNGKI